MPSFWENILRFPRFFISSTLGLILTIVGPLFNLLRSPQTALLLCALVLMVLAFLVLTLQAMLN